MSSPRTLNHTPPNTALQRTRAAVLLQRVPRELSSPGRRRAPLSFRTFGPHGTQAARIRRSVGLVGVSRWTVILAAALAICCGKRDPQREHERGSFAIGDNPNTSGNSFSYGVSAEFREPELRQLYNALNGPHVRAKLQRYICPQVLPTFTVTVVLWYEGPYQERLVRLQMTPPLYKEDGRLEEGLGYLFVQTVKALDKGPPIDYGYRNPHDGSPIKITPYDRYHEPTENDCAVTRLTPQL